MTKDRLAAFTDAILAIIMTILVLELKRPDAPTWEALWAVHTDFFSYVVSFFWLGAMWINIHNQWHGVEKINNRILWWSIIMLFFASIIPYVTAFVGDNFESLFAQLMYSIVVIGVSISNLFLGAEVAKANPQNEVISYSTRKVVAADLIIKAVGILLAILIYPPLAIISIIVAGAIITFVPLILNKRKGVAK